MTRKPFICRNCGSGCPIIVTVDGSRVVAVEPDFNAPLYRGYTCPKARMLPQEYHDPDRLLHSLKRLPDGRHVPISSEDLVDEITERLARIIDSHGPQAVAAFLGNSLLQQPVTGGMIMSFLTAIGSPMLFSNGTLDQPGLSIALGLNGIWQGGRVHPREWDALLLVGGNPVVSKQHLPQNPAWQLKELDRGGLGLVVIDPRKTETARRAKVHLQLIPGEDPTVLAGLVHLIFERNGVDDSFVAANTQGVDRLRDAVSGFTPGYVAARAGISPEDLEAAARILIEADRGDTALGVGPSMATRGTLSSYLALCIQSLRGWWAREGELVSRPRVLTPPVDWRAQPIPPRPGWGFGLKLARGLQQTIAGLPAAAAPEMMLSNGDDRIRAFFSHGGIYHSWPETRKTVEALKALDLFVMHDVRLTATAQFADYVIATYSQLETQVSSHLQESIDDIHPGYAWNEPYGAYRAPVVSPPEGADLMAAWQVYYRVAQRLDLSLAHINFSFTGGMSEPIPIDMKDEPTTDDLLELACANAVVPLSKVKAHAHGAIFEEARDHVKARDPACAARLQLADPAMIEHLAQVRSEDPRARRKIDRDFPLQLICRRMIPTTCTSPRPDRIVKTGYNPLWMHSTDMERLDLTDGDPVEIKSRVASISSFVERDDTMRPGVVAMAFGFGRPQDGTYDPRRDGANVNELTSWDDDPDAYHGMPRMSAIPVAVCAAVHHAPVLIRAGIDRLSRN